MSFQASWGRCGNGCRAIIPFPSCRVTKTIFKAYYSNIEKFPLSSWCIIISWTVALQACCGCRGRSQSSSRCFTLSFIHCVFARTHTLSHQFHSLEKEWGEKKHSLSTWPSELYTQSSGSSPCINPRHRSRRRTRSGCSCWLSAAAEGLPGALSGCFEDAKDAAQTERARARARYS